LPKAPQYWGATATDIFPSLGNDTSSTAQASGPTCGTIRSAIRRRTNTGSQVDWFTNCCRFCSLPSGSRSAMAWIAAASARVAAASASAAASVAAPPVQHQPPQIAVALGPLILARHRREHISHEQRQLRPSTVHFMCIHTPNMPPDRTDRQT